MMSAWLTGKVIHGLQNGRRFGFPTVNMDLGTTAFDYENGVYAVDLLIDDKSYQGMLYVGTRPTLHLQQRTIEIHIFDFNQDIYDKGLSFKVLKQIRKEMRFPSVDALVAQLQYDKQSVQTFFNATDIAVR